MPKWIVEPLAQFTGDRKSFSCGDDALDNFLHQFAGQYDKRQYGRTHIARSPDANPPVLLGYYTLANSSVTFEAVPIKTPRHPIPTLLLARLAIDKSCRNQRLGEYLLFDALKRSVEISRQSGVFAVEVDAYESARLFYEKYGFKQFLDSANHLFLPMKEIAAMRF